MVETRIIFMGTPDFAVPSLARLIAAGPNFTTGASSPWPPSRIGAPGTGKKPARQPGERWLWNTASRCCSRPVCARTRPQSARCTPLAPDLLVVAAYGLILPQRAGHPTLRRRQRACQHPARVPGNVAHHGRAARRPRRDRRHHHVDGTGMDTGPMLAQARQAIAPRRLPRPACRHG
ncbi:MAG: hypothetical protein R2851_27240 [Caldilineaceae bacterium]